MLSPDFEHFLLLGLPQQGPALWMGSFISPCTPEPWFSSPQPWTLSTGLWLTLSGLVSVSLVDLVLLIFASCAAETPVSCHVATDFGVRTYVTY